MKKKKSRPAEKILFFIGILAIWQAAYLAGVDLFAIWKSYAMPSPAGVWGSFCGLAKDGTLFVAIAYSLIRGGIGYLIALVIGAALGFLMNHFEFLHRNLRPLIMGIQTLPSICWVPFSILWFGLTQQAIVFVVVMGSAFGMAIAVDNAIRNVPPLYLKAAKTMGANSRQVYWKIILPASLPEMVSGLKQGWSFAWRALMSGEVMTTCTGLGQTLITGRNLADINQVMLVMVVIVLTGIVIDQTVFCQLEKRIYAKRGM